MLRTCIAATLVLSAGSALALPPLTQNERVMGELVAGEVGYQIQKHCPTIKARTLRAIGRINDLKQYAEIARLYRRRFSRRFEGPSGPCPARSPG